MKNLKDLTASARELFNNVQGFVQSNPTPAGFVASKISPIVQSTAQKAGNFLTQYPDPMSFVRANAPQQRSVMDTPVMPFIPQSTLPNIAKASQFVGQHLQRVNLPEINAPQALKAGIPALQLPEQINSMAQSYGRTLSEPQKHPLETALNIMPFAGFTKTKGIQESLRDRVGLAKSAEEAATIYNDFADNIIKTGAVDDVRALRASLNKELTSLVGATGNYKKDFAIIQTLKDDTQIGGIIKTIQSKISSIDDVLTSAPKTAKERLSNLLNYPKELENLGYNARQVKFIDAKEAQRIIDIGISPLDHPSYDKMMASTFSQTKNYVKKALTSNDVPALEKVQNAVDPFISVKTKVNLFDYLRTPEKVLQKIGLGDEAKYLRSQYERYLTEIPEEIKRISDWQKRVPSPESNEKIFRALDGESIGLTPLEGRVAAEIKGYLADWATKLKLPPSKQISSYITHIYKKGEIEGEFDPELAKLIDQKVAKGVYDPFLLMRKNGRVDYLRDTWAALDAYTKRAVRKYNLDPALTAIEAKSGGLELSQYKYLQKYTDRINMRPTEVDTLIDNFIKSTPVGYKLGQRPVTAITQKTRQMTYRGALGLNISSAIRNLTQGANTYAELGEKYTALGYLKMLKNYGGDELERVGVLRDSFIQDKNIGVYKNLLSKMDKGLFFLFEQAEKINRGSAYWGAKARALAQGKTEQQAIEDALAIVRKTQFSFGVIDTPLAISSDIAKTFTQFMSYNLKQGEFIVDKLLEKDFVGLVRYVGATIALQKLMKDRLGIRSGNEDSNTIQGAVANTLPSPAGYTPPAMQVGQALMNSPKAINGTEAEQIKARGDLMKAASLVVPAGAQIKKTLEGARSYITGESTTPSGNTRFLQNQNIENMIRSGLFGQYATPEAQQYFDSNQSPLSEKQSQAVRDNINRIATYQSIMNKRAENQVIDQVKEIVNKSGVSSYAGNHFIFIDPKTGDTRSIDTTFEPTAPKYTGNTELDKELRSRFYTEITKKKSIITDLFEQGQINKDQAEEQLNELAQLKASAGGGKSSMPPIRIFKTKAVKLAPIKIKASKPIKITKPKTKPLAIKISKVKSLPKVKPIESIKPSTIKASSFMGRTI